MSFEHKYTLIGIIVNTRILLFTFILTNNNVYWFITLIFSFLSTYTLIVAFIKIITAITNQFFALFIERNYFVLNVWKYPNCINVANFYVRRIKFIYTIWFRVKVIIINDRSIIIIILISRYILKTTFTTLMRCLRVINKWKMIIVIVNIRIPIVSNSNNMWLRYVQTKKTIIISAQIIITILTVFDAE